MKTAVVMEDLLRYSYLSSPRFSPDGKRCAFVRSLCDPGENAYLSDIWLEEDGAQRRLTSLGDAKSFLWEDGFHLLFPACRDKRIKQRMEKGEKRTVYQRIDIRGGEAEEAFSIPLSVKRLEPLGEGKYAVVAAWGRNDPDFGAMDEGSREAWFESEKGEKDYEVLEEIPFWHNGGGFSSGLRSRLFLFDSVGGSLTAVTDEYTDVGALRVCGRDVLFAAGRYMDKMRLTQGVRRLHSLTGEVETLLEDGRYGVDELFQLEDKVVFLGTDFIGGVTDFRQNAVFFSLEEGTPRLFYDGDEEPGGTCGSDCRYGGGQGVVQWDGRIWYKAAHHCGTRMVSIDARGKARVEFFREGSVDSFDVCRNGLLFVGMTEVSLQELYLCPMQRLLSGSRECRRVSSFNQWVEEERLVSKPAAITSTVDGVTVEGFCLLPADYRSDQTYPAILDIHGGPRTAYGAAFFHEMQVWAGAGYFVLYCNPRGSDGRGEAFADIRGKYGTIDFDDLMAFTDRVLSLYPQIDPRRVGVTGGSYGGFMTNWIIGHSRKFACAVSQRSISNWISKFNTTDIGYYFNAMQHLSTPWDDCGKLWWHSPLKYADKAVTPTLFIHSDQDYRCWMAEGLQMFTALKYHGVEARLCLFHGENHELSRSGKPLHRLRRLKEMQDWFDGHLKA